MAAIALAKIRIIVGISKNYHHFLIY